MRKLAWTGLAAISVLVLAPPAAAKQMTLSMVTMREDGVFRVPDALADRIDRAPAGH